MSGDEPRPRPARISRPEFTAEEVHSQAKRTTLDEQLWRYLQEVERDRAEGNTIRNLRNEISDVRLEVHQAGNELREVMTEQRLMRLRLDRHGKDIRDLKAKIYHSEGEELDTGAHQVEDLKRHLREKQAELKDRRDSVWWRRQKIQWAAAIAGVAATTALGGIGTVLWYVLTHGGK